MKIVSMKVADLVAAKAQYNPRKITEHDAKALRTSLERWGEVVPMVFNARTKTLVGGHQRVDQLSAMGQEFAEVSVVDLDANEERALNLALNRVSGAWKQDSLAEVLLGLEPDMQALAGFSEAEVKALGDHGHILDLQAAEVREELKEVMHVDPNEGETDPDAVPDVETFVKAGELWGLGRHRLLCGDSTSTADVERLLDSAKPMLMVTDPPYGVNYDGRWRHEAKGIHGGGKNASPIQGDERTDWGEAWALFSGAVAYVWSDAGSASLESGGSLCASGFEIRNQIIWRKASSIISRGHYNSRHEMAWYAVRKGATAHWIGDASASTVWDAASPGMSSVPVDERVGHGTQKPVECMARPIANHESPEVYDPFLGSGTTLIACEQYERACYAMDIDAHYCSVAIRRWEAFTGKKAERQD